jgi:cytochrome c oxidase subunit 2
MLLAALVGPGATAAAADASGAARTIDVLASRYQFEPSRIEVTAGERVALRFRSKDGAHGFEVKALKLKTKVPKGGEPVTLEFVADRPGTFPFACSEYCGAGHPRMKGTLVVIARVK